MEGQPLSHDIGSSSYDPFRRSDGYGEIGTGPYSFLRKCMPTLRPVLLPATASFVTRGMLLVLGFLNIRHKRIMKDPDTTHTAEDPANTRSTRRSLPIVVSNHVSWVDILLAGYLYREKSQPPAGAQEGGFRSTADRIAERAQQKWKNPDQMDVGPLVIFAEGTTTNGKFLLPFRTGAFVAGVPVQPVLVHYPEVRGRPSLAWETVGPLTHAFLVLSSFLHSACIYELPLYCPSEDEQRNPLLFATNVRSYMLKWAARLGVEMQESSSGLTEKREYHSLLKEKFQIKQK